MATQECCDNPRFFFCECVAVEAEGTVSVIALCTNCGTAKATRITVAQGAAKMRLLNEEKSAQALNPNKSERKKVG